MNWKTSLARVMSNFFVTFFGTSQAFGFQSNIPELEVYFRAFIAALGISGISIGYELRRYSERKPKKN